MLELGYWLMLNTVLYSKELTDKQKLLFCSISSLCAEKGYCRAKNKHFAELFWVHEITISKNISLLQKKGFIFIVDDWDWRKIYICEHLNCLSENTKGVSKNAKGGLAKMLSPYIYTNNTIENNCPSERKSTTSSKKKELTAEQTEAFERVWKEYPQKTHKKDARKHFLECDYDELMFDARQKKRMVELEVVEKQYVKWWWRWMEEFSPQSDSQKLQDMRRIFEKHMEIWWEDMRERMERMKDDFPDVDFKKLASDYNEKNKIKFNFTP